jgi:hypothetical protein
MGTFVCDRCRKQWPDVVYFSCPECHPGWAMGQALLMVMFWCGLPVVLVGVLLAVLTCLVVLIR